MGGVAGLTDFMLMPPAQSNMEPSLSLLLPSPMAECIFWINSVVSGDQFIEMTRNLLPQP